MSPGISYIQNPFHYLALMILGMFTLLSGCRESKSPEEEASISSSVFPEDCNKTSGYFWSTLRQDCVELFREGRKLKPVSPDVNPHGSVFVIFNTDKSQAEMYMPFTRGVTILLDKTPYLTPAQWTNDQYLLIDSSAIRLMEGNDVLYEEVSQ